VDATHFRPGKKLDKKFRLLMVADFGVMKGTQYLLEAWRDLALDDAELVLVGAPLAEMQKFFSKYSRELSSVRFIGHADDPLSYYQQASAFIFPSLAEGWGKVVSEAQACGLPVIVTTETGAKDAIKDGVNGFVVPAREVAALTKKIRWLYEHPREMARMGEAARRTAVSYSWNRFERGVKDAFREIRRREEIA
jgi:glycosyltransferase involved in cell wall biosynthesis